MKHVKLFEQFIATLTEGAASSMLSKLGKGVEHETVASMMDQDEEVSKEIMSAMKALGCSAEECGVIGDYHTDDWNKVLKVAKSSGVEFIEVKDDNGSAIVFSLNEAKLNENTKYLVTCQEHGALRGAGEHRRFADVNRAIAFAKKEIKNNERLKSVGVYTPDALFDLQYDEIIAWWGDGSSHLDLEAKKDPALASKKIEG
jgi:hypothetical protein